MKLKQIGLASLLTFGLFSAVVYTSCTKDPCNNVQCANGGSCSSGNCVCPTGFDGADCESLAFLGKWNGTDVCGSGTYTVNVSIDPSSTSETTLLVSNPAGFGTNVVISGVLNSDATSVTFTNQDVGAGRTLNGTMTLSSNNNFTFSYTVVGQVDADQCQGNYTKQ